MGNTLELEKRLVRDLPCFLIPTLVLIQGPLKDLLFQGLLEEIMTDFQVGWELVLVPTLGFQDLDLIHRDLTFLNFLLEGEEVDLLVEALAVALEVSCRIFS